MYHDQPKAKGTRVKTQRELWRGWPGRAMRL